jgi:hypothetical protein
MTDITSTHDRANDEPRPQNHDPLVSVIAKGLEIARKPAGWASLTGTITLSGYAAIAMTHSDIAAISVVVLGVSAMVVVTVALCKKAI